jgi:hypothetical protein
MEYVGVRRSWIISFTFRLLYPGGETPPPPPPRYPLDRGRVGPITGHFAPRVGRLEMVPLYVMRVRACLWRGTGWTAGFGSRQGIPALGPHPASHLMGAGGSFPFTLCARFTIPHIAKFDLGFSTKNCSRVLLLKQDIYLLFRRMMFIWNWVLHYNHH